MELENRKLGFGVMKKVEIDSYLTDLQDGDIVRHFHNRFNIKGIEIAAVILRSKSNLTASHISDINISRSSSSGTGGLKQSRREGSSFRKLVKLFSAVVINKNMKGEHILDSANGEMLVEESGHGRVV